MGVSEVVCPTKDAIRVFLELLLDPMLPATATIRGDPSLSKQHNVAKQVHSVVLLYNYYHRKQHPELPFVAFKDFCKFIVDLRPALLTYMKFTQKEKPDETDLVDADQQLSLTEKAIVSSCDICTHLDASKNVPSIEGWPISKVAVFLVDSKKENCGLVFSSITAGVWSLIEKDVDASNQSSEVTLNQKSSEVTNGVKDINKKRRVIKKPTKIELNVDEDRLLQVGYSAVKETAGVNSVDIMLLESHTVYSQSKVKTASRFYIMMKCSQSTDEGFIQVPIKDLIESFGDPLVKKSSSSWTVTPVVDYFHVLPYSKIISEWISREETFSNSLQDSKLAEKQLPKREVTESYVSSTGMSTSLDNKQCNDTIETLQKKENDGFCTITQRGTVKEDKDMDVDNSLAFPSKTKKSQHISSASQVHENQEILNRSVQHQSNERTSHIEKEENGFGTLTRRGTVKEDLDVDVDNSLALPSKNKKRQDIANTSQVSENQDILNRSVKHKSNECTSHIEAKKVVSRRMHISEGGEKDPSFFAKKCTDTTPEPIEKSTPNANNSNTDLEKAKKVVSRRMHITEAGVKDPSAFSKNCTDTTPEPIEKSTPIANNSNTDIEKVQNFIALNGNILSETALNALIRKRNTLTLQQRVIEDELALCNMKIQRWLSSGEHDLELKIESIIEGCNSTWSRSQGRMCQNLEDHRSLTDPYVKRKRLAEAVLTLQTPCQDLDDICHQNNWILPNYSVSPSNGEFQANVKVKGVDFEHSCGGNPCSSPLEARNSAAAQMLNNLRNMAKSAL